MNTMECWTWDVTLLGDTDMKIAQFPEGVIDQHSNVFASISEINGNDGRPFMGSAFLSVWNVVPMDGSRLLVAFRIGGGDFRNLDVRVQLLISR